MMAMDHDELVRIGYEWAKDVLGAKPVFAETEVTSEYPDVLAFSPRGLRDYVDPGDRKLANTGSLLIECKASRSDFHADAEKRSRQRPSRGLGFFRYYLAPEGLLEQGDIPQGWGFLEYTGNQIRKKIVAGVHPCAGCGTHEQERKFLRSVVRRLEIRYDDFVDVGAIPEFIDEETYEGGES